jgi:hypothetical protein
VKNQDIRVTLIHEPRKLMLEKFMRWAMAIALFALIAGQALYLSMRIETDTVICGHYGLHMSALVSCAFLATFSLAFHLGLSYERRRTVKIIESFQEAAA